MTGVQTCALPILEEPENRTLAREFLDQNLLRVDSVDAEIPTQEVVQFLLTQARKDFASLTSKIEKKDILYYYFSSLLKRYFLILR